MIQFGLNAAKTKNDLLSKINQYLDDEKIDSLTREDVGTNTVSSSSISINHSENIRKIEESLIKHRFNVTDSTNREYVTIHDTTVTDIIANYNNLSAEELTREYNRLIAYKVLILLNFNHNSKVLKELKDLNIDLTDNINYENNQESNIISRTNENIVRMKEEIKDISKKAGLKGHYAYIQELEMYIMLTLVFLVIIVALSFNFDENKREYVKYLVIGCVFLGIINYSVYNIYNNEGFAEYENKNIPFYTDLKDKIKEYYDEYEDANTNIQSKEEIYNEALSHYMDFLLINLKPYGYVLEDIEMRMNKEKQKTISMNNLAKNANFSEMQSYYEMNRDSKYNMDIIYLILYLTIVSLLLNSWYLEMYDVDFESMVLFMYVLLIVIGIIVFMYRIHVRMRQVGIGYYF